MNMEDQVREAQSWIVAHPVDLKNTSVTAAEAWEMNSRILGSLLIAYSLGRSNQILELAKTIAGDLLQIFDAVAVDSPNFDDDNQKISLLEMGYVSFITGDDRYRAVVLERFNQTNAQIGSHAEAALMSWIAQGDKVSEERWTDALSQIEFTMVKGIQGQKFVINDGMKMSTQSCRLPAILAYHSLHTKDSSVLGVAHELMSTCYRMWHGQVSGLGPELSTVPELKPAYGWASFNLGNAEFIQSLMFMWRVTRSIKYRRWGLEVARAIGKNCKVPSAAGYAGLTDVSCLDCYDNWQDSGFIGKTLKNLYLLFSSDTLLPLEKWAFNLDGHPIPIFM